MDNKTDECALEEDELLSALAWLKKVAGVDDEYLGRWTPLEWRQWQVAMRSRRDEPCPSVPAWMQPLMPEWSWDFSLPWPCVAQLWPTSHDWFSEARERGDFRLEVEEPAEGWAPTLDQLEEAWGIATRAGAAPQLAMNVLPAVTRAGEDVELSGVSGAIEAFYIAASPSNDAVRDQLEATLRRAGARPIGPLAGEPVLAWEWLYG